MPYMDCAYSTFDQAKEASTVQNTSNASVCRQVSSRSSPPRTLNKKTASQSDTEGLLWMSQGACSKHLASQGTCGESCAVRRPVSPIDCPM